MPKDIGRITPADEYLIHQIANTFDVTGQSDLGWTEKIWGTFGRKDGSLQCDLGIGKYPNRDVIDGFAGCARGVEQWTVRASRSLSSKPDSLDIGPLRYEIVEPLTAVRAVLEPNDAQPVSFDLVFTAHLPPFFEDRDHAVQGGRVVTDVVRWHQAGTVEGRIWVDGEEIDVRPDEWFAFRDRSWGVRQFVGAPPPDVASSDRSTYMNNLHVQWSPLVLKRRDGSHYELQYYFRDAGSEQTHFSAHINEADGTQIPVQRIESRVHYARHNRGFLGGTVLAHLADGVRTFHVNPASDTGFRLGPALYFGWNGEYHGSWKGDGHLAGEYVADCEKEIDALANPIWQGRDRILEVREGDAHGYGVLEHMLIGDWHELIDDAN